MAKVKLALVLLLAMLASCLFVSAQTTAFVYQGRLNDGASPANGSYDLRFALYDALAGGTQQGNTLTSSATGVTNGLFTTTLDFGDQFSGAERWLEIAVRPVGGGAFTTLTPRQRLASAPYAVTAARVTGPVSGSLITAGSITSSQLASNAVIGQFAAGAVVVTEDGSATNLTAAGYKSFGKTALIPESWVTMANESIALPESVGRGATMVWTGKEMILWSGPGASYDPALDFWRNGGGGPSRRAYHSAVWDGTQMFVWGGESGGLFYDGGAYDPSTGQWTLFSGLDGTVGPRAGHSTVWTGSEVLLWGGYTNSWTAPYNFGFSRSGARMGVTFWDFFSAPITVQPRRDHVAFWTGSEMLIWGGVGYTTGPHNSGARYNRANDSWASVSTSNGPGGRSRYVAVWTGTELLIWGGVASGTALDTGARYNPASDTWTPMTTAGAPGARQRASAVWTGSELIVWGGTDSTESTFFNDGKRYNPSLNVWNPISTTGAPAAQADAAAVWTGTEMVVLSRNGKVTEGGRYNPATDTWRTINRVRNGYSAVWTGSELLIWGGYNGIDPVNSGMRYNPSNGVWAPLPVSGAPQARSYHTAVWTGSDMIVWGGVAGSTFLADGARFNPVSNTWTPINANSGLAGRYEHTAVWTGNEMVVWGGSNGGFFNNGARYNPVTDAWTPVTTSGAPALRTVHTATWTGSEMIIWGGLGASFSLNTGGRYNPVSNTWLPVSLSGAPSPRTQHAATWTGTEMVVWGGNDPFGNRLNTGAFYKPATDTWTTISTVNAPTARASTSAVWTGNEIVIWGGDTGTELSATGGVFNPRLNAWLPMASSSAPGPRSSATAVWTGNRVLFWGGYRGPGIDIDPAAYFYTPERALYYYLKL